MNAVSEFRPRSLCRLCLALATFSPAACGIARAQLPEDAVTPLELSWPAVEWSWDQGAQTGVGLQVPGAEEGLGPIPSLVVPLMREDRPAKPPEPVHAPGALRLGDSSFTRTAESFNLHKKDVHDPKDISRQLGTASTTAAANGIIATPINSGAVIGIGLLVLLVALAIVYYDREGGDRRRRKKVSRRRHRRTS